MTKATRQLIEQSRQERDAINVYWTKFEAQWALMKLDKTKWTIAQDKDLGDWSTVPIEPSYTAEGN